MFGRNFSFSLNRSTFAARPGGEIGRRTVFRSQRGKPCAGSNPVPGTKNLLDFIEKVFSFWKRAKLALLSEQNEKTCREAAKVFVTPLVGVSGSPEHTKHAEVIQSRAQSLSNEVWEAFLFMSGESLLSQAKK